MVSFIMELVSVNLVSFFLQSRELQILCWSKLSKKNIHNFIIMCYDKIESDSDNIILNTQQYAFK